MVQQIRKKDDWDIGVVCDQTYLKLDIDNRDIMENRLQSKIKEAIDEFTTQSNQITDGGHHIPILR